MSDSADFYKELTERNPEEISLRFGKAYEGRHPSNPIFQEFEGYLSKATNLQYLQVAWDNTCAEVILKSLLSGIEKNKCADLRLSEVEVWDDGRPLHAVSKFDFAGIVTALGRRKKENTIERFAWGHNNYGESWWLDLGSSRNQKFSMNQLSFPNAGAYETTLANLLDEMASDGVKEVRLYLCRMIKYMSFDGLERIFGILATKFTSLTSFSLRLTPQSNDYCSDEEVWGSSDDGCKEIPYGIVISALASMVSNCPDLEEIEIALGTLSHEHEEASKQMANAIVKSKSLWRKNRVNLKCRCARYCPWNALPEKDWGVNTSGDSDGDGEEVYKEEEVPMMFGVPIR